MRRHASILACLTLAVLGQGWALPRPEALPQTPQEDPVVFEEPQESPYVPKDPRAEEFIKVEFKPTLNTQMPLDAEFRGDDGVIRPLQEYLLPGKPTLLAIVYYRCPTMCNLVLNGMVDTLKELGLKSGEDFGVLALSFDAEETHVTAKEKKANALEMYGDPGASGWHFVVGDEPQILEVTRAANFGFKYDELDNQYAHGSGLLVLTPDGRISRFLPGLMFPRLDTQLALVEAGEGKIGSLSDKLALLCYRYDPQTGKYGLLIHRILTVACLLTVAAVAWLILGLLRAERRRSSSPKEPVSSQA